MTYYFSPRFTAINVHGIITKYDCHDSNIDFYEQGLLSFHAVDILICSARPKSTYTTNGQVQVI